MATFLSVVAFAKERSIPGMEEVAFEGRRTLDWKFPLSEVKLTKAGNGGKRKRARTMRSRFVCMPEMNRNSVVSRSGQVV